MCARAAFLIAFVAAPCSHGGDLSRWIGIRPPDPEIRSLESYVTDPIELRGAKICIFPFAVEQEGTPRAPRMSPAFIEALDYHLPESQSVKLGVRPEAGLEPWRRNGYDVVEGLAKAARAQGCQMFVDGLAHRAYRKPGGGYRIRATIALYELHPTTTELRWRGRKAIDWRLRQPVNECLLLFAEQVLFDWMDLAAPPPVAEEELQPEPQACDDGTIGDSPPCLAPNSTPTNSSPAPPRSASSSWTATAY